MDSLIFHPKVVHIPIALAVLMPLIAGGTLVAWWCGYLPKRAWLIPVALQAVLVASGFLAMQSGEADEDRIERVVAESVIEEHEEAAELFVWSSAAIFAFMLVALVVHRPKAEMTIAVAAALGTLFVFVMGYRTGEAGGALVYEHGAASAYVSADGTPPPAIQVDDDD
ncbi:MAG: hypothetical protein GY811_10605 [Myxococcales bacterium]|nr:hypothetical protein [Myxococcales bacterium]